MDRQVLWILKKIPELEDDTDTVVVDDKRIEVTFATTIIGFLLITFIKDYSDTMREKYPSNPELLEYLGNNFCKVPDSVENQIQAKFFEAADNLKTY